MIYIYIYTINAVCTNFHFLKAACIYIIILLQLERLYIYNTNIFTQRSTSMHFCPLLVPLSSSLWLGRTSVSAGVAAGAGVPLCFLVEPRAFFSFSTLVSLWLGGTFGSFTFTLVLASRFFRFLCLLLFSSGSGLSLLIFSINLTRLGDSNL